MHLCFVLRCGVLRFAKVVFVFGLACKRQTPDGCLSHAHAFQATTFSHSLGGTHLTQLDRLSIVADASALTETHGPVIRTICHHTDTCMSCIATGSGDRSAKDVGR